MQSPTPPNSNKSHSDNEEARPWYKEPYVWMLIAFPASTVIAGIIFISQAVTTKDSLVNDNYYKDGLAINQELAWDKKAKTNDIKGNMTFSSDEATFEVTNTRLVLPSFLKVYLSHPTLEEFDQELMLQKIPNSRLYKGLTNSTAKGRFYMRIESPEQQWRIRTDIFIETGKTLSLP